MFLTFFNFAVYVFIVLCTCTLLISSDDTTKGRSSQEQLQKEMSNFIEILDGIKNDSIRYKLEGKLEEVVKRAMKADTLLEIKGGLERDKKYGNENVLLNIWRLLIDDYEDSFPQSYEADFEKNKVKYDKSKFTNLVRHDLSEERRRQRWLFYCENPPNQKMTDLVASLKKENVDFDTFSRGIAKAYRLLSDKFHAGFYKRNEEDPKKYFMFKIVVIAMRMLLKQEDILDELIEQTVPKLSD